MKPAHVHACVHAPESPTHTFRCPPLETLNHAGRRGRRRRRRQRRGACGSRRRLGVRCARAACETRGEMSHGGCRVPSTHSSGCECCHGFVWLVSRTVITRGYVVAAAVDACLSHGLKRRVLGLFGGAPSTFALLHKISALCPAAAHVLGIVLTTQQEALKDT